MLLLLTDVANAANVAVFAVIAVEAVVAVVAVVAVFAVVAGAPDAVTAASNAAMALSRPLRLVFRCTAVLYAFHVAVSRLFQQQQLIIGNNSCFTMVMTNWFWAQQQTNNCHVIIDANAANVAVFAVIAVDADIDDVVVDDVAVSGGAAAASVVDVDDFLLDTV